MASSSASRDLLTVPRPFPLSLSLSSVSRGAVGCSTRGEHPTQPRGEGAAGCLRYALGSVTHRGMESSM